LLFKGTEAPLPSIEVKKGGAVHPLSPTPSFGGASLVKHRDKYRDLTFYFTRACVGWLRKGWSDILM
jgi:hypothetical protein